MSNKSALKKMENSDYIFASESALMNSFVTTRPTPSRRVFNDDFILCSFAIWLLMSFGKCSEMER